MRVLVQDFMFAQNEAMFADQAPGQARFWKSKNEGIRPNVGINLFRI
jgi:hypothetical protein